jgi:membrane protein required for colicin V production
MENSHTWVDIALLAVLGLSAAVGLVRGLVFEVLSLLGWVAAYFAAQWFAPALAVHVPVGQPGSALNHGAAFAGAFIAALLVWAVLARLVRAVIRATPLSIVDRVLGALFGVARGMVVLLAVATVVGLTPLSKSAAWQASQGRSWLQAAMQVLKPVLPSQLSQHLPA